MKKFYEEVLDRIFAYEGEDKKGSPTEINQSGSLLESQVR